MNGPLPRNVQQPSLFLPEPEVWKELDAHAQRQVVEHLARWLIEHLASTGSVSGQAPQRPQGDAHEP